MENLLSPEIWAYIVTAVIILERLAKLIPDTATGVLGIIRKVSKVLSFYVPNDTGEPKIKPLRGGTVSPPPPKDPPSGGG